MELEGETSQLDGALMEMRRKLRLQDECRVLRSCGSTSPRSPAICQWNEEAEFDVKQTGTHTVRSSPTARTGRSEEECATSARESGTRRHVLLSLESASGTRCREGHLREGPTRVQVDGDELKVGRGRRDVKGSERV